jgi:uncharacterized coiled-coil protein SlyX
MKSAAQRKIAILPVLTAAALACLWLLPKAQAVVPPPDGGYPNFNTAEGQNALFSLTTGSANTAVGWFSLFSNTDGSFNTATGAGSLLFNTADNNTAFGAAALLFNTTGSNNTATGTAALLSNTEGFVNTADGSFALSSNTTGAFNTATGQGALLSNTTGSDNTAIGAGALQNNTEGGENTAIGLGALTNNTTGSNNIALGFFAGTQQTTGSDNIYIGFNLGGTAGESNACYIKSIFGQTATGGSAVFIDANHKLGTLTSSKRFKEEVKPMEQASEILFALKPVTFHYKKEVDPAGVSQFGLVAEDVEKVNPDLVVCDKEGKPYSVRYDQVNAMLLNEFLKEHRKVEEQAETIAGLKSTVAKQQKDFQTRLAEQEKQIKALASGLQRVSDRLESTEPNPQVAVNNP